MLKKTSATTQTFGPIFEHEAFQTLRKIASLFPTIVSIHFLNCYATLYILNLTNCSTRLMKISLLLKILNIYI
jgi:hypothetical protein